MLVLVVDVFGGEVVFDHLVLQHPHAGFGDRQPGQFNPGAVGRKGRAPEDFIHLFLAEEGVGLLGLRRGRSGSLNRLSF